jgi:hypothetical protein
MRSAAVLVSLLLLGGAGGCHDSKKKMRREATIARLAKMDCKAIAEKATRCDTAVRKAADERQRKSGKKHLSLTVTLSLTGFKSVSRCLRHVEQRVRFLRKSCSKYGIAADVCVKAQDRYLSGLRALHRCFAFDECAKIAACYVESHGVDPL